jgi:hypothetical protein
MFENNDGKGLWLLFKDYPNCIQACIIPSNILFNLLTMLGIF